MITDIRWQRAMIAGLELDAQFEAAQLGIRSAHTHNDHSRSEVNRAVANIRAWRAYLPEACVRAMITDGWQWST
jgi:L-ascorbate metabolism protein UlaG (beta-lactamase superfamily)